MILIKRNSCFTFSLLSFIGFIGFGQVTQLEVAAISTDANIDLDFTGGDTVKHQIYLNPSLSLKNKLLVFLPGTGAKPREHYSEFCKTAASEGYHVIGLVYKNTVSVSGTCGTGATNAGPLCSESARKEIIYGADLSLDVQVDTANSIMNRLAKLLLYMEANYPNKGWNSFIAPSTQKLNWQNIALAGHSQGGGHAALIAKDTLVHRVLFFNSPSDRDTGLNTPLKQPSWFSDPHITPDSAYYAFYHQQNGGPDRLDVYKLFGLGNYGQEVNVDTVQYPYNLSHILFSDSNTFDFSTYLGNSCGTGPTFDAHSDIIIDCEIALDNLGNTPYRHVWKYMLSSTSISSSLYDLKREKKVKVFPNPSRKNIAFIGLDDESTITVYSSRGVLMAQHKGISELNMENYPSGLYLIVINVNNRSYYSKVQKI